MAAPNRSVRGAGSDRSGATDTTMLMWKTIDANPGITRDELFTKIEHEIPAGWALRRYSTQKAGVKGDLRRARRFVMVHTLSALCANRRIAKDHASGGYAVLTPITRYRGERDAVDETRTAAAEHLNGAYDLRIVLGWQARGSRNPTAREREAAFRLARAYARRERIGEAE